jgi:enoyl-CoA hydratase/carnithine racemase
MAPLTRREHVTQTDTASDVVLFEVLEDNIALITLNRPEALNAVNGAVAQALEAAVTRVEDTREIRAAILTSSQNKVFCAGADLAAIAAGRGLEVKTDKGGFAGIVDAPRIKPWIAVVEGAALAGGCEIVMSCDMIVASKAARFGLPEVKRGLFAGARGVYRLPRRLPRNVGLELVATGDPLDAGRAYGFGLVNRLTEPGDALEAAIELARSIVANAPLSVQESLGVARLCQDLDENELQALCEVAMQRVFASKDSKEGPRAFMEKRKPVWLGE